MKSLKLNKMSANRLTKEQLKSVRGGIAPTCSCGCCYVDNGGSNTGDNLAANYEGGFQTKCPVTHVIW